MYKAMKLFLNLFMIFVIKPSNTITNAQVCKRSPYEIFDLPTSSSISEVKSAYRQLAKERHPDKAYLNGLSKEEANESFNEMVNAYNAITNGQRFFSTSCERKDSKRASKNTEKNKGKNQKQQHDLNKKNKKQKKEAKKDNKPNHRHRQNFNKKNKTSNKNANNDKKHKQKEREKYSDFYENEDGVHTLYSAVAFSILVAIYFFPYLIDFSSKSVDTQRKLYKSIIENMPEIDFRLLVFRYLPFFDQVADNTITPTDQQTQDVNTRDIQDNSSIENMPEIDFRLLVFRHLPFFDQVADTNVSHIAKIGHDVNSVRQ